MTVARIRLVVAAALFLGWIGWLGYAVSQKEKAPVVSRAQLTAATHLLVAEVSKSPDGLPAPTIKILEVVRGENIAAGSEAEVLNLASAKPPGPAAFPGPGVYLLPVVGDGKTFRIAGMPRSPGYEASSIERPPIYLWNDDTKAQLKGLGILH